MTFGGIRKMKKVMLLVAMLALAVPSASYAQDTTGTTMVGRFFNYIDVFGLWSSSTTNQKPIYIDGFGENPYMKYYTPSMPRTTLPAIAANPAQFQPSLPRTTTPTIQNSGVSSMSAPSRGSVPYTVRNNGYTIVNPR